MSDVTQILSQIESGDPSAAEQLLPLVYDELRKLAQMPDRCAGFTLKPRQNAFCDEPLNRIFKGRDGFVDVN